MPRIIDALEQLFTVDSLASGPSLLINYSSASGSFSVGETVTGGTSGATLVVNTSIPPQVTGSAVVGTFQVGETITGGTSGVTATVDNFFLYDFPAGAAPLENGEIDFFESGSSTVRKTTYSDAAETIPNANPLVIRGDGRVPNVYGSGTYRIVVRTSTGIQILARDPIGGNQGLTFGSDWSAPQAYFQADVVRDDGKYWQSLTNNNLGNVPSTDGGVNWVELPFTDIATNTAAIAANTAAIATKIGSVVEDTSPQLGGQLDAQGNNIVNGSSVFLTEKSSADGDQAGQGQFWEKDDTPNKPFFTDDAGTDYDLTPISFNLTDNFLHIQDQRTSGTNAGGATGGADNTRVLNTVLTNNITGASLSSNQIILPAGDYYVEASAPAFATDRHRILLYNVTDLLVAILGQNAYNRTSGAHVTSSSLTGVFSIADQKTFELRHYTQSTRATDGLGTTVGDGREEIYADIRVWKVS